MEVQAGQDSIVYRLESTEVVSGSPSHSHPFLNLSWVLLTSITCKRDNVNILKVFRTVMAT